MDLSNFSFFNFGHDLEYYSVDQPPTITRIAPIPGCMLKVQITQSKKCYDEQWVINSFDQTVGIIGGYTTLIWSFFLFLIGGYQSFKMDQSMAKSLYTRQEEWPVPTNSEEDVLEQEYIMETIQGRIKYDYHYV